MDAPSSGEVSALEATLGAADRGDTDHASPGAAPPPGNAIAPVVDPAQEWIDAVMLWGPALREALPDWLQAHWTDERLQKVGVRLAAVAKHYSWTLASAAGHPVAALVAACFPLIWPAVKPIAMPYIEQIFKRTPAPAGPDVPAARTEISPPPAPPGEPKPAKVEPVG